MDLEFALTWVFAGPGAGTLAYKVIPKIKWIQAMSHGDKRVVTFIVAALLAVAAYGVAVFMQYIAGPVDTREWVEKAFFIASTAVITSQTLHGYEDAKQVPTALNGV